ncbi:amidohydrolase family protein [Dehalogenimonas etheniformans]|uniref:amidohydrolase family protein n=1 Tax=Dehalogenimonas etheniformans TaxID=1536648 RepID=UPI001868D4A6|nr:amidohydrolase family protein [Dehalogenimonas etheniformans]QNT75291.2 amidohydrolase family protein [Dehalogenimonas etheniformans]
MTEAQSVAAPLFACYNRSVIIDFHTHAFSPKIIANRDRYVAADPCFATLYNNPKAKLTTADQLIAEMDRCGIDKSVVLNIGWSSHELCVESNDYILASATKYPERIIPFIAVQPVASQKALNEIERCVQAGAKGVGEIRPDVQGLNLDDQTIMSPMIESLVSNKLILLSHVDEPVGHHYPGKGKATPSSFYSFIQSYPDLKLVLAHWGGGLPFYSLMPEVRKAFYNVWFDSAASPFLYLPPVYKRVAELSGVDKILFGSDFPLLSPRRGLDELVSSGLAGTDMSKITGGNAASLLELGHD